MDDGSEDGTRDLLHRITAAQREGAPALALGEGRPPLRIDNLRIFVHDRNRGKGAALRRGFREARGRIVLIQDADLEYDPRDYRVLVDPILEGCADVVYGTRFTAERRGPVTRTQYLGNRVTTTFSNWLSGLDLTDAWVCYKAFRRDLLQALVLKEDRFGFELEVTARIARAGWRLREVPITYHPRGYRKGKKITWRDALRGLWCALKYNLLE